MGNIIMGVAIVIFIIAIAIEGIWAWKRKKNVHNAKETASNIFIFTGIQLLKPINVAWKLAILGWFSQFRLTTIPTNALTVLLAVLLVDLLYYWQHRLYHEIRLLWTLHNVHHSSPWMNFTTSFRLNWMGWIISPIFYVPAILLGFSIKAILVFFLLNLLFQFFLHTESIGPIPGLEGWLNTPSAHRVHHGSNPLYIDKNYGGILMVWDRLFGTYQEEVEPVTYGVTTGFMGHNPFKVIFWPLIQYIKGEFAREKTIVEQEHPPTITQPNTQTPTTQPSPRPL